MYNNLTPGNVIFLNQFVFMKNKEGVVSAISSAIEVTLRNYKYSDPAVLVHIFSIGRNQRVIFLQRMRIQGSGVPLCVPNFALRYRDLNVSGYKSHSFRIGAVSWAAAKGDVGCTD